MDRLYEAAFEALLRGSDDLVLVIDREGRMLDAGALARSRFTSVAPLIGSNLAARLSVNSGRALQSFLDALGTDGAITLDHAPDPDSVGVVRRVRYTIHAIPGAGLKRDFLLVGREAQTSGRELEETDPSAIDPLTGLANRNGMATGLARLGSSRGPAGGRAATWILMVDIDRFKVLNDTHGHLAGDAVLTAVARVLVSSLRDGDLAARYGGDEFLLAGHASDPRDVVTIASRVVESVRALAVPISGSDRPLHVTISVGGALAAADMTENTGIRDVIEAADRALYRAKQDGRDRAVVESGEITLS